MVYLYDDNSISLDGPTSLSFDSEDVTGRFEAYGWHVQTVDDVNDLDALRAAIKAAPGRGGAPVAHPREHDHRLARAEQAWARARRTARRWARTRSALAKEALGWDPDAHFLVPDGVYEAFSAVEKGAAAARGVDGALRSRGATPTRSRAAEWDAAWRGEPLPGFAEALPTSMGQGQARDALGRPAGHGRVREAHPDDGRRRRGPERVDEDRVPRTRTSSPASTPAATSSSACASTAWAAR